MINLVIKRDLQDKKQIVYAFYYLTQLLNVTINVSYEPLNDCVNIFYGVKSDKAESIFIPMEEESGGLFYNNIQNYEFLSYRKLVSPPYEYRDGSVEYKFDILSVSSYLLSCKEEYKINQRDDMNRFLSIYSCRKEYIKTPFFDVNASILFESLKLLDKNIEMKNKQFEILLTHDVDSLNSRNINVFLHNCKELIFNKNKKFNYKIKNLLLDVIFNRHLQIDNFIELETKYGAKSEFYFIEGVKHRLGKRYELSDVKYQIEALKKNGFPIGLHTNYFSYDNLEAIKSEINAIERFVGIKVYSGRNHYLRFNIPSSWSILSKAGILCDSTLGYTDRNGYRAATSNSFVPFDINKKELVSIYEIPLVIMDGIIMEQDISFEEKWKDIKIILDGVIKYRGTASVLWHEYLIYNNDYKNMYEKILNYVKTNGGRFVLTKDIMERKEIETKEINDLMNVL